MSGHQQQTQKTQSNMSEADAIISQMAEQARDAQAVLGRAEVDSRNQALLQAVQLIRQNRSQINRQPKRYRTWPTDRSNKCLYRSADSTADRIEAMATGLEDIAELDDPLGVELARWTRPNGLDIARISTALGVIGVIYESRPNVTAMQLACVLNQVTL